MTREEFEKTVRDVLKALPKKFRCRLENVAIIISDKKQPDGLLGLYEGVSLTERVYGSSGWPDKITLFKKSLEDLCRGNKSRLKREIEITLKHEIAHHLGMDEDEVRDCGL